MASATFILHPRMFSSSNDAPSQSSHSFRNGRMVHSVDAYPGSLKGFHRRRPIFRINWEDWEGGEGKTRLARRPSTVS